MLPDERKEGDPAIADGGVSLPLLGRVPKYWMRRMLAPCPGHVLFVSILVQPRPGSNVCLLRRKHGECRLHYSRLFNILPKCVVCKTNKYQFPYLKPSTAGPKSRRSAGTGRPTTPSSSTPSSWSRERGREGGGGRQVTECIL